MQHLVDQLMAGGSPEERRALLDALESGQVTSIFDKLEATQEPAVAPAPSDIRGFRVRLDLEGATPPVWRRLELPGDLTMPRLHDVIQAAMGWTDSHLHRFRTGPDRSSPHLLTQFDLEEGDRGALEDDIRLDQLVEAKGDELWYEYDFGDGWDHVLTVEAVLDAPPPAARCVGGRLACPPEDCGGLPGYEALAGWVRGGHDDAQLPGVFADAAHARAWLPDGWHPDRFDLGEANAALAVAVAEPVAVGGELAELARELERCGNRLLRHVLARPLSHGPVEVSGDEAARLTESYRILLDVIGDGVALTGAGWLPPRVVEQVAERAGITTWWIGKSNREELTRPVADLRRTARALGLVSVRNGRLAPTAAGRRCRENPVAMWRHIVGRLPLAPKGAERQAGWMALAVVGSGTQAPQVRGEVSDLLAALGWCGRNFGPPPAESSTLEVLDQLAGVARTGRRATVMSPAVAATARAVIRRAR